MHPTDTTSEWSRLWSDPTMLRLRKNRRSFFMIAWAIFGVAFCAFVGFAALAPEIVAKQPVAGLSFGLILSVIYVATVMGLGAWYVRRARQWDAMAEAVLRTPDAVALDQGGTGNV